jgi:hypothetical protein
MTDSDLNFLVAIIGSMLTAFWLVGRVWLAVAGRGSSSSGHSSAVALRRSGAVVRPTTAAPAGKAASRPASSAGGLLGGFGRFVLLAAIIAFVAVVPLLALLQGSDPVSYLLWFVLYGGITLAYALWPERRQPLPKPRVVNYPVSEDYQARWGTAEQTASVPLYIACERIGGDPNVLEAYPATVCDVLQDEFEWAKAAGLSNDEITWHLAAVIGGAGRKPSSGKASKQPGGRGGAGGGWGGRGRVRGGGERVIEAKAVRGWLGRGG